MKSKTFYLNLLSKLLLLIIVTTVYLPNCLAQNYTEMGLPDGAKARLGKGRIHRMLYSQDGKILAVVSSVGIWLYESQTYQELSFIPIRINRYNGISSDSISFSGDSQTVMSGVTEKNTFFQWDVNTGKPKETQNNEQVPFSSDTPKPINDSENKSIQQWNQTDENLSNFLKEINKNFTYMTFSPDGHPFAGADGHYNIHIWDTSTRKLKKRIKDHADFAFVTKVSLSPDGKTLASLRKGEPIRLWDVASGENIQTLTGYNVTGRIRTKIHSELFDSEVDSVAFSPDGKTLASGGMDSNIRLWNIGSGKLKKTLNGHYGFIKCLTFSPDGKTLASGSDDKAILLWNTETGKHVAFLAERMDTITCISFSQDGSMLAGGSTDGNIHLWDVVTVNPKMTFTGHVDEISNVVFSPDGSTILSVSWDSTVRLWDVNTGEQNRIVTGQIERQGFYYWGAAWFTSDGIPIAIRYDIDNMHLWDIINGQYMRSLIGHSSYVKSSYLSADGYTLATYSADGTVLLWDLTNINKTIDSTK